MKVNDKIPARMHVKLARAASIINLAAIIGSGVLFLANYDGYALCCLIITIMSFVALLGTGVYYIIGGKPSDEFQINMARKAYYYSYCILGVGLIFGTFLIHVIFIEMTSRELDALIEFAVWAVMDVVMVLPVAVLAWLMPKTEINFDE